MFVVIVFYFGRIKWGLKLWYAEKVAFFIICFSRFGLPEMRLRGQERCSEDIGSMITEAGSVVFS